MMTVGAIWREVQARLEAAREVAPLEGKQLVRHVTGLDEVGLLMAENDPFPTGKLELLEPLVARRLAGEPLAHILGFAWFYGRVWSVTDAVLIPRPDTEVLVQETLRILQGVDHPTVLEVGTGSGCVIGTLLAEVPAAYALGAEIDARAAAVTRHNLAAMPEIAGRWVLQEGDFADITGDFSVVVSNPPYVSDHEWEGLDAEVKDHEPKLALTGCVPNPDGLLFYRRLAAWGRDNLSSGGWLCVETGWQQAQAVRKLLKEQTDEQGDVWCEISVTKDLAGRERVVSARRC